MKYKLLCDYTSMDLEARVNNHLEKGWSLGGNAFMGVDVDRYGERVPLFCQPMIYYGNQEDEG